MLLIVTSKNLYWDSVIWTQLCTLYRTIAPLTRPVFMSAHTATKISSSNFPEICTCKFKNKLGLTTYKCHGVWQSRGLLIHLIPLTSIYFLFLNGALWLNFSFNGGIFKGGKQLNTSEYCEIFRFSNTLWLCTMRLALKSSGNYECIYII